MAIDFIQFEEKQLHCTKIIHPLLSQENIQLSLLRLDLLHPQISGNKWFKLKYNLAAAKLVKADCLLSFGGAYSNHLHAIAYAGKLCGIKTIGIVRGESVENETLTDCKLWGMELHFISRSEYREKDGEAFLSNLNSQFKNAYIIPEGGCNEEGLRGCKEILPLSLNEDYQWICCPVGTGTTLTGLIETAKNNQQVLGFAAIKNGYYLEGEIEKRTQKNNWVLNQNYHFGGFAKTTKALIEFNEAFYKQHQIVLDYVYTAKMMYGIFDLVKQGYFKTNTHLMAIHTGGLQGNRGVKLNGAIDFLN